MTQEEHEFEVIRRLLADEHVAEIEDVLRRDGWASSAMIRPTEVWQPREAFVDLVDRWYRQLSSTGRLPGGCSRRDVARAVIERRMHVDCDTTRER
ncbi:hypothetical protein GCM10027174_44620 [Salinifilum aidingensis]